MEYPVIFYEKPHKLKMKYRSYFILGGIIFLSFPIFNYYFKTISGIRIFNILFFIAGILFILLGIGEFSNNYDRFIKITKEYIVFKLRNNKTRSLPWNHIIRINVKKESIIFTFKNEGTKEILLSGFNIYTINNIKDCIKETWEMKANKES